MASGRRRQLFGVIRAGKKIGGAIKRLKCVLDENDISSDGSGKVSNRQNIKELCGVIIAKDAEKAWGRARVWVPRGRTAHAGVSL